MNPYHEDGGLEVCMFWNATLYTSWIVLLLIMVGRRNQGTPARRDSTDRLVYHGWLRFWRGLPPLRGSRSPLEEAPLQKQFTSRPTKMGTME